MNNEKTSKKENIAEIFHENTKITHFDDNLISQNIPYGWVEINYKSYPRFPKVNLSRVYSKNSSGIKKLLMKRRSIRDFKVQKISFNALSKILYFSAGITTQKTNDWNTAFRAYPSGGARYPLELYLVVFNVKDLVKGIYHFNVKYNVLELIKRGNFKNQMIKLFGNTTWVGKSGFIVLISAVFGRTLIKYGNRGYRLVLLEAGHLAQNIYLLSTSLKLGCCALGGFLDNQLNSLLSLEKTNESVIYTLSIGKPSDDLDKKNLF